MKKKDRAPKQGKITRSPFPNSKKIYVSGTIHPKISVAMREISLNDSIDSITKNKISNKPVTVYDTSGPFTDPNKEINIHKGIDRIRENWIMSRGDVDQLNNFSSKYSNDRLKNKELDHLRFSLINKPLRAKSGKNVTQLHYAKKGIITPEMEYIAIRENQKLDKITEIRKQHKGEHFGASIPNKITPEL